MRMDPVTWTVVAVLASLGVGVGAGWGLKPDSSVKALEAQTEAIDALSQGNEALVAQVQATALIDAEAEAALAAKLTDIPPQCIRELGGDPMSAACAWSWCIRTGSSDAQRCQDTKLADYLIERFRLEAACPDTPPPLDE
jgi:hypothetical protein